MEIREARYDKASLLAYCNLFRVCFPGATQITHEYLAWLYAANPCGRVVGFDAWEGDILIGHYACIPCNLSLARANVLGLLSLNTATHPSFQGKGIFTKLASRTYEAGANKGYECVFGVANANSTPGFVRKLGFDLVSPLFAKIGVGNLGFDFAAQNLNSIQFCREWNTESLLWRVACPTNPVRVYHIAAKTVLTASARRFGIQAIAEIPNNSDSQVDPDSAGSPGPYLARVYLGLAPAAIQGLMRYVNIPVSLKPSPLNLIFLSLKSGSKIDPAGVFFNFIDFDAY